MREVDVWHRVRAHDIALSIVGHAAVCSCTGAGALPHTSPHRFRLFTSGHDGAAGPPLAAHPGWMETKRGHAQARAEEARAGVGALRLPAGRPEAAGREHRSRVRGPEARPRWLGRDGRELGTVAGAGAREGPEPPDSPPPLAPLAFSPRAARVRLGRRCGVLMLGLSTVALAAAAAGVPPVGRAPAPGAGWESVGLLEGYDAPEQRWKPGHRGVDLAAPTGTAVVAPAEGTVSFVGSVAGRPTVSIEMGGGWRTTLEPVEASVAVGDAVRAGQAIGTVAAGGHCSGRCVHWGLRAGHGRDERYRDPRTLVQDRRPSVLWIDANTPPR